MFPVTVPSAEVALCIPIDREFLDIELYSSKSATVCAAADDVYGWIVWEATVLHHSKDGNTGMLEQAIWTGVWGALLAMVGVMGHGFLLLFRKVQRKQKERGLEVSKTSKLAWI